MTAPWAICWRCGRDLYPRPARRSDRGWICAHATSCANIVNNAEAAEARAEDNSWMTVTGEHADGAARRLGCTVDALGTWCKRHGLDDEWHQLLARQPRDHNADKRRAA